MDSISPFPQFRRSDYCSIQEVAHAMGAHPNTVRDWITQGKIPAVRIGNRYYISRENLNLFPVPVIPSAMQA